MNQKLKVILENAIEEEEYFYRLYKELAGLQTNPVIKARLLELSEQERLHKEKLETLDFVKLGKIIIPEVLDTIHIDEEVSNTPKAEFHDIELMFKFAIKQEALAKTSYSALANAMEEGPVKDLFLRLAKEEEVHEKILVEQFNIYRGGKND